MVTRRDYLSTLTVGSISITAGCMGGDDSCGPGDTTISSIKDNRSTFADEENITILGEVVAVVQSTNPGNNFMIDDTTAQAIIFPSNANEDDVLQLEEGQCLRVMADGIPEEVATAFSELDTEVSVFLRDASWTVVG